MDIINLLQLLGTLLAGASGAYLSAELVKIIPKFPQKQDGKNGLRRTALRLSAGLGASVFVALGSYLAGEPIDPANLQALGQMAIEVLIAWFAATTAYKFTKPAEDAA